MNSNEVEEFYNRRLQNVLRTHSRMVLDDKDLSKEGKSRQMEKVEQMLQIARGKTYTVEQIDRIEKEDVGYGR